MHLIVGLGNPGIKYEFTRHNIGFLLVDCLLQNYKTSEKSEQKSLTYKTEMGGKPVLLVKPQTFMNLSGEAVRGLLAFYKIPLENLLVIHDDIDQNFMSIKFQQNSSSGGQNGINSIHQLLGTQDYTRMKLGVGRPTLPKQDVVNYVLQKFSQKEEIFLKTWMEECIKAVETFVAYGYEKAASLHNLKAPLLGQLEEVDHLNLNEYDFKKLKTYLKNK